MTARHIPTHYATLRVARGASGDEVRRAYRQLAQKYHPDRHPARDAVAATMARINGAYDILGDEARRAQYDSDLAAADLRSARARQRIASINVPTLSRSSWLLLIAIAASTTTTLAFVATYTIAPRQVHVLPSRVAAPSALVPDTAPLAPQPAVEPWKEPPPRQAVANPATDPVTRLVRDGVVTPGTRSTN